MPGLPISFWACAIRRFLQCHDLSPQWFIVVHQCDDLSGAKGAIGDAQFVEFAAKAVAARPIIPDTATKPQRVTNRRSILVAELCGNLRSRRRRLAFTFKAAIYVLFYLDRSVEVLAG